LKIEDIVSSPIIVWKTMKMFAMIYLTNNQNPNVAFQKLKKMGH